VSYKNLCIKLNTNFLIKEKFERICIVEETCEMGCVIIGPYKLSGVG
jgi:hypothetical protein